MTHDDVSGGGGMDAAEFAKLMGAMPDPPMNPLYQTGGGFMDNPGGFAWVANAESFSAEPGWVSGPDAEPYPDEIDESLLEEYQQAIAEWEVVEGTPPSFKEYFNEAYWKAKEKYDREEEIAHNEYMEYLSTLTEEEAMEEMYGAETTATQRKRGLSAESFNAEGESCDACQKDKPIVAHVEFDGPFLSALCKECYAEHLEMGGKAKVLDAETFEATPKWECDECGTSYGDEDDAESCCVIDCDHHDSEPTRRRNCGYRGSSIEFVCNECGAEGNGTLGQVDWFHHDKELSTTQTAETFGAESFEAPYGGTGALMDIGKDTPLANFTDEELTKSSAIHGDFDTASIDYSGHQNIEVRAESDWDGVLEDKREEVRFQKKEELSCKNEVRAFAKWLNGKTGLTEGEWVNIGKIPITEGRELLDGTHEKVIEIEDIGHVFTTHHYETMADNSKANKDFYLRHKVEREIVATPRSLPQMRIRLEAYETWIPQIGVLEDSSSPIRQIWEYDGEEGNIEFDEELTFSNHPDKLKEEFAEVISLLFTKQILQADTDAYTYAYTEGHSDSRKREGFHPSMDKGDSKDFSKILRQKAEMEPLTSDIVDVSNRIGETVGRVRVQDDEDDMEDVFVEVENEDGDVIMEGKLEDEWTPNIEDMDYYYGEQGGESVDALAAEDTTSFLTILLGTTATLIGLGLLSKKLTKKAEFHNETDEPTEDPDLIMSPNTGDLSPANYEELVVESTGYAVDIIPICLDGSFMGSRFNALPKDRFIDYNEPGIGAHTDIALTRNENFREPEQSMVQASETEVKETQAPGQSPYFQMGHEPVDMNYRVLKETTTVSLDPAVRAFIPQSMSGYTGQKYAPPSVYEKMFGLGVSGITPAFISGDTDMGANRFGSRDAQPDRLSNIGGPLSDSVNAGYTDGNTTISLAQWSIENQVQPISDTEAIVIDRSSGARKMIRRV